VVTETILTSTRASFYLGAGMVLVLPPFVLGVLRICSLADWAYQSGFSALFHPLTVPFSTYHPLLHLCSRDLSIIGQELPQAKPIHVYLGLYFVRIPPHTLQGITYESLDTLQMYRCAIQLLIFIKLGWPSWLACYLVAHRQ
jgi:hypothetical protein